MVTEGNSSNRSDPDGLASRFDEMALPCLDRVYWVARRLTRNNHDAEDLVQETYLRAFRAFEQFEEREFGIRPWLLKILHNTFLNREARAKRAPRLADLDALDALVAPGESRPELLVASPPRLEYENLDAEVRQAIDALPTEFRAVLVLWATHELSYQEIADILDVPIGTVMSRLHRARQQLVRALHAYAKDHGLSRSKASL